jgi:hypothetical protein
MDFILVERQIFNPETKEVLFKVGDILDMDVWLDAKEHYGLDSIRGVIGTIDDCKYLAKGLYDLDKPRVLVVRLDI